jgi:hypothetical protein
MENDKQEQLSPEDIDKLLQQLITGIDPEDEVPMPSDLELPFEGQPLIWEEAQYDEGDLEEEEALDERLVIRLRKSPPVKVKYAEARRLAKAIELEADCRYYAIVKGTFIFGDFIEALIGYHRLEAEEIWITTLGMNENNVDSLINLSKIYNAQQINLLVSSYFFGVERHNMIQYLIEQTEGLPIDIAAAGSHAKIALIKANGVHLCIHGSANLSSNVFLEQFELEDNEELYQWNRMWLQRVFDRHTIIKGANRQQALGRAKKSWHNHLWDQIKEE